MGGWCSWILAALGAVVVLATLARRSFRASVRAELLEVLRAEAPGVVVVEEAPTFLRLRMPGGGEAVAHLERLFTAVAGLGAGTPLEERRALYREWAATVRESSAAGDPLDLEAHGARVLPRLVSPEFFQELPPDAAIPHTSLDETGLAVAYVLDHAHSVAYLTRPQLDELGLDRAQTHALALRNLSARTPPELLRQALAADGTAVIRTGDTYDAARLLLLPPLLAEGEERLVAVPDRDSLVLLPPGTDMEAARRAARAPGSDRPLFDQPLRVRRDGFALA